MNRSTEILIKVRKIVRSINLESKRIQKEFGVSIPQVLCLSYLKNSKNYQNSQLEIRKYLNLNSSTVTGIIGRLEKRGLIARLPNISDKRINIIALTAAGDKLLDSVPPLLHNRLSGKLEILPQESLEYLVKTLDMLINMLDIQNIEASPVLTFEGNLLEND